MPSIKDFETKTNGKKTSKEVKADESKSLKNKNTRVNRHKIMEAKKGETKMDAHSRRPRKEDLKGNGQQVSAENDQVLAEESKSEDFQLEQDNLTKNANQEPKESNSKTSAVEGDSMADTSSFQSGHDQEKIQIDFPGSFILRSKFQRTFEALDKVATDWVYDGDFEGLPVGHPLAQIVAAKALKKAKELEKKAQNTQAYSLAKMGFEFAKSKLKK